MVCEECVYKLDALFDFREKSMKTEYVLNNMLKNLYNPTVNNELGLQMDTLLCAAPISSDSLHIRPSVEVIETFFNLKLLCRRGKATEKQLCLSDTKTAFYRLFFCGKQLAECLKIILMGVIPTH